MIMAMKGTVAEREREDIFKGKRNFKRNEEA